MKRSVRPCPTKVDAVEGSSLSRRNLHSLFGKYLLHQLHSSRSRVFKRGLSYPQSYISLLALYRNRPPPPNNTPLDLSPSKIPVSRVSGQGSVRSSASENSYSEKEPTWKPLMRSSSLESSSSNIKEWFPVDKKPFYPGEKPKFYPLFKDKNELDFPWMNSLNRIFLQEKKGAEGKATEEKNEDVRSPQPTTSSGNKTDCPNANASSQGKQDKIASSPTMKSSTLNPFKITPSNTWPENTHESSSKPILAPSKFGASSNYGFGKFGSNSASSPIAAPTLSVSSFSETSKPAFKLKPPVLGRTSQTSTTFSVKRPVSNVENEGGMEGSSPKGIKRDAVSSPDPKRVCTSPTTSDSPPLRTKSPPTSSSSGIKNGSPNSEAVTATTTTTSSSTNSISSASRDASSSSSTSATSSTPSKDNSPFVPVPVFVPLNTSSTREPTTTEESNARVNGVSATSPPLSSNVGNAGFIFGQNLENRVSGVSTTSTATLSMRFSNGETNTSTSSSGLNLFTAAANNLATHSATADGAKSLSESSREFSLKEESLKTKYEEVQIVTGEEGEKNVIQMNCKLYGWGNGSWQERGRGILRLNDREIRDELHSRLVIRTQGTLTVMLNAKIWAEMSVEKPNDKSVRFTASDVEGQPKIYLVMGSPKDITLLHNSLEYRVAAARSQNIDEKERESEQDQDQDSLPSLSV